RTSPFYYFLHPHHADLFTLSLHDALPICLIMEGAEFTENIINGVERPVKAAELSAFTLRVRAGNTDVLTDAEENVNNSAALTGRSEDGSAGMPRPISYAVFCLKKKKKNKNK